MNTIIYILIIFLVTFLIKYLLEKYLPEVRPIKMVFSGQESSGKSLMLAKTANEILERNIRWAKESEVPRKMVSRIHFSKDFEQRAKDGGIKIIYWKNIYELKDIEGSDIFWDEIHVDLNAKRWADLGLDIQRWLEQNAKIGNSIFATAQDFAQVDLTFRRLTRQLYFITKIIGSERPHPSCPPVKKVWGLCVMRTLNADSYDEKKKQFDGSWWSFKFFKIRKEDCDLFDTNEKVERGKTILNHNEHECPICLKTIITHTH